MICVIAGLAHRMAAMYGGYIIEEAAVKEQSQPDPSVHAVCWAACRAPTNPKNDWSQSKVCLRCCTRNRTTTARCAAYQIEKCLQQKPTLMPVEPMAIDQPAADMPPERAIMESNGEVLLSVKDLVMHFPIKRGVFQRTVGMSMRWTASASTSSKARPGLVRTGCGKSTTGRAILQLYKPTSGSVIFDGKNLVAAKSCASCAAECR